jgi:hypothetical protein
MRCARQLWPRFTLRALVATIFALGLISSPLRTPRCSAPTCANVPVAADSGACHESSDQKPSGWKTVRGNGACGAAELPYTINRVDELRSANKSSRISAVALFAPALIVTAAIQTDPSSYRTPSALGVLGSPAPTAAPLRL